MQRRGRLGSVAFLALGMLFLAACSTPRIGRHEAGRYEHPCRGRARTYHYLRYLPPGHGRPRADGSKWPLLVYLPGASTWGCDVRKIPDGDPPHQIECGRDLPMVVLSVMTPGMGEAWSPEVVVGVIDHAIRHYDVDPARVYLTGVCVGGTGVWDTIKRYPERIAAAMPVCAWGSLAGIERAAEVPVWAFHGTFDVFTPAFRHERLLHAHRCAGGSNWYTPLPRMHWIWSPTYCRDDVYAWLLAQRKGQPAVAPSAVSSRTSTPDAPATSRTSARGYARGSGETPTQAARSPGGRAARTAR